MVREEQMEKLQEQIRMLQVWPGEKEKIVLVPSPGESRTPSGAGWRIGEN